jgi:2-desacetyl-2-hydroxyethyl bacteriochlorophyllide A dehydrogenase
VARRLYFTGPRSVEVREVPVGAPGPGELAVETVASGVSPGTELLVYRDEVPAEMPVDESLNALSGTFDYPLAYGYAAVGEVVAAGADVDDDWVGRRVFAFVPHGDRFLTAPAAVHPVDDHPPTAATLLATAETAVNLALDGHPRVGERVVVFGAGAVGLCATGVLAPFPLASLVVVEPVERRRDLARAAGADRAIAPAEADPVVADDGADLVYELSGRPATLDDAVDAVGYDGRVVVGSWYGTERATLDLGGRFHRDRVEVVSSQVSTLAPGLRGRWDRDRRFAVARDHLDDLDDTVPTETVPFADAPDLYGRLDRGAVEAPHVAFTYRPPASEPTDHP